MKILKISGNIIYYDDYKFDKHSDLVGFLEKKNIEEFLTSIGENIILVLGGDGTMLKAIQKFYKKGLPFLGINFGNKGFLLNNKDYLSMKQNKFTPREYPLLEIKKEDNIIGIALNEVNIYSPEGRLVHIKISLSNNQKLKLKGDGIIISTPIGSTGHNKSYSGNILPHSSTNLVITSKGTLNPDSSKIIEGNSSIFIENIGRKNIIGVNTDGNVLFSGEDISLQIYKSENIIRFLILEKYIDYWDNKVLEEQGFNL